MKIENQSFVYTLVFYIIAIALAKFIGYSREIGIFLIGMGIGMFWESYWNNRLSKEEKNEKVFLQRE